MATEPSSPLFAPTERPGASIRRDRFGVPFEIAALRREDRTAVQRFYEEFEPKRAAQGLPPENPLRIRAWVTGILSRGIHLLAWRGDLIGHAFIVPTPRSGVGEYAAFLAREYRARGIGTELNQAAAEAARAAGFERLWLTVEPQNRAAVRSYEKAGFEFVPHTLLSLEPEMELRLDR